MKSKVQSLSAFTLLTLLSLSACTGAKTLSHATSASSATASSTTLESAPLEETPSPLDEDPLEAAILESEDAVPVETIPALGSGEQLAGKEMQNEDMSASTEYVAANLNGSDLTGADLSKSDLSSADLGSATLDQANLTETNLSEASLSEASLLDAIWEKTILTNADLGGADIRQSKTSSSIDDALGFLELLVDAGARYDSDTKFSDAPASDKATQKKLKQMNERVSDRKIAKMLDHKERRKELTKKIRVIRSEMEALKDKYRDLARKNDPKTASLLEELMKLKAERSLLNKELVQISKENRDLKKIATNALNQADRH